ncbi:MAG TPA: aspartate-semialdehyde dehydrogenase [Saprospiraceae bacterium]|nr:aspartate-semialdehyde dehydrogenase [Saprospiraceae bacterium]
MKIAVVGITGMVGQVVLDVLKELKFPVTEFVPVASERSLGKSISWDGQSIPVKSMQEAIDARPQIAIFSAGGGTSLEWAPKFAEVGCFVVDNSSAWRMDANIPLVVPEINIHSVTKDTKIIANPNCSTIQMVMVLNPLHQKYKINRLVISTYQSFTGTGMKAVKQYNSEKNGEPVEEPRAYHHPIFENCIPQCDTFLDNGYTKEEMKLVNETKKILGDQSLKITSTAVRVPVHGGHSESVNVEFFNAFDLTELKEILNQSEGIIVQDNPTEFEYPTPLQSKNKNEVFVGRIRRDESKDNALNLWITADNLRKGAATNAVQIAHYLRRFF